MHDYYIEQGNLLGSLKVIQSHQNWYQSKAIMLLSISLPL